MVRQAIFITFYEFFLFKFNFLCFFVYIETFAGKGLLSASGGASSGGGGGGGGRVRVEREQNAVKELAMRPPVPSTGIIDYTAPPPPAPLKTLLPAMLQWNVDGGVYVVEKKANFF